MGFIACRVFWPGVCRLLVRVLGRPVVGYMRKTCRMPWRSLRLRNLLNLSLALQRGLHVAVCLTLALVLSNPAAVWATATEEPGLSLDTKLNAFDALGSQPEPVLVSEVPTGPYMAGEINDQGRRQTYAVASYISNYNKKLSWDEVSNISSAIVQYSSRYGVDYRLVTSLIAVESAFRKDVISSSGAIGMGQLKPDTAKWLGVVNPFDPVDNIAGTTRFLAWLVKKYNGNLEAALSGYYQGPGYVDRNGITPVCMPYLEKINRALAGLI